MQIDLVVDITDSSGVGTGGTLGFVRSGLSGAGYQVDSFFDVFYVIGSSGQDGVLKIGSSGLDGIKSDSFFDVEYGFIETEMIAMSLTSSSPIPVNAGEAIDFLNLELGKSGSSILYFHVGERK